MVGPGAIVADRLGGAYAWRSLLQTGVVIAGGSDFPVEDPNPFHGIHAAVARPTQPEERMTREEADIRNAVPVDAQKFDLSADIASA